MKSAAVMAVLPAGAVTSTTVRASIRTTGSRIVKSVTPKVGGFCGSVSLANCASSSAEGAGWTRRATHVP
jgi:hypothetical protein